MTNLVIAGLAVIAALFVGIGPLSRLPYFQPHTYCVPQEQETQEASYEPAGGGRAG